MNESAVRSVCVFCGASAGRGAGYHAAAREVGRELGMRGIRLVYGGGRAGLMGAVADGALEAGGQVTGVITRLLHGKEMGHTGLRELRVVETMHERKMTMADLADAFIALPGGLGTLDETFEILAWAQLGIHRKPVGLLNSDGFYNSLMTFLDHVEREGFLRLNHRTDVVFDSEPRQLVDQLCGRIPRAEVFTQ